MLCTLVWSGGHVTQLFKNELTLSADLNPLGNLAVWQSYSNVAETLGWMVGGPVGGQIMAAISWKVSVHPALKSVDCSLTLS